MTLCSAFKFKMAADGRFENFKWPYPCNGSSDPVHTATMLCFRTLYITVDTLYTDLRYEEEE